MAMRCIFIFQNEGMGFKSFRPVKPRRPRCRYAGVSGWAVRLHSSAHKAKHWRLRVELPVPIHNTVVTRSRELAQRKDCCSGVRMNALSTFQAVVDNCGW